MRRKVLLIPCALLVGALLAGCKRDHPEREGGNGIEAVRAPSEGLDGTNSPEAEETPFLCSEAASLTERLIENLKRDPRDAKESLALFRTKLDKCGEEVMASAAACDLFRHFPKEATVAFDPVYGSTWDGWGLWIKRRCIPKVITSSEPERRRFGDELTKTVVDIQSLLPHEATGHTGRVGELRVETTLLDLFLRGRTPTSPEEFEKELRAIEAFAPTIRTQVEGVLRRAKARKTLSSLSCPPPERSGAIREARCGEELLARVKTGILTQFELARDEGLATSPRKTPRRQIPEAP